MASTRKIPPSFAPFPRQPVVTQDGLGLRQRKKRDLRQRLSDTATTMFVDRGFDQVRVSEIAQACGVSEKTVYNYFPTKESLLFDRGDAIAEALERTLGGTDSVIAAVIGTIVDDLDRLGDQDQGDDALALVHRFTLMVQATPALRAALADVLERLTQLAAASLAARNGLDVESPENQIAAAAIVALWRVQLRALGRYADGTRTPMQVRDAVVQDVMRAAAVVENVLPTGRRRKW